MFKLKQLGLVAALAVAASSASAVNVASGKLWHVPEAVTFNAIPANVPGTTPDVTFDVNSPFNFSVKTSNNPNCLNDSRINWRHRTRDSPRLKGSS